MCHVFLCRAHQTEIETYITSVTVDDSREYSVMFVNEVSMQTVDGVRMYIFPQFLRQRRYNSTLIVLAIGRLSLPTYVFQVLRTGNNYVLHVHVSYISKGDHSFPPSV